MPFSEECVLTNDRTPALDIIIKLWCIRALYNFYNTTSGCISRTGYKTPIDFDIFSDILLMSCFHVEVELRLRKTEKVKICHSFNIIPVNVYFWINDILVNLVFDTVNTGQFDSTNPVTFDSFSITLCRLHTLT